MFRSRKERVSSVCQLSCYLKHLGAEGGDNYWGCPFGTMTIEVRIVHAAEVVTHGVNRPLIVVASCQSGAFMTDSDPEEKSSGVCITKSPCSVHHRNWISRPSDGNSSGQRHAG